MITLDVKPGDRKHLRRQIAENQSLHTHLMQLARQSRDLSNAYRRFDHWLLRQAEGCPELSPKIRTMRAGIDYQTTTLERIAAQIEEVWDIGLALQKLIFHDDTEPSPLEFGFPIDVIGKPPTDQELGDLIDAR